MSIGAHAGNPRGVTINSAETMYRAVKEAGIIPFFENPVPGWSVEEKTDPSFWFDGDSDTLGPWDWKIECLHEGDIAYGKFLFGGKAAFATVAFPLFDIDVFHSDRGSEFDNAALDEMFEVFGITRSLSKKGCPYDNAVVESTNKILKAEFVYRERFDSLEELQIKLSDYVWWYNHERMHSTLGYMSPVEFREKSLTILSK